MVPWESLGDLARYPLRSRVFRHAKRHSNSSSMPYDDKTIEDPERDRWKDKKVDRRDAAGMAAQKRAHRTKYLDVADGIKAVIPIAPIANGVRDAAGAVNFSRLFDTGHERLQHGAPLRLLRVDERVDLGR